MTKAEVKEIVQETIDRFVDRLPCRSHQEMLVDHETTLKNGLKDNVAALQKVVERLLNDREEEHNQREKTRRGFWVTFAGGAGVALISAVVTFALTSLV